MTFKKPTFAFSGRHSSDGVKTVVVIVWAIYNLAAHKLNTKNKNKKKRRARIYLDRRGETTRRFRWTARLKPNPRRSLYGRRAYRSLPRYPVQMQITTRVKLRCETKSVVVVAWRAVGKRLRWRIAYCVHNPLSFGPPRRVNRVNFVVVFATLSSGAKARVFCMQIRCRLRDDRNNYDFKIHDDIRTYNAVALDKRIPPGTVQIFRYSDTLVNCAPVYTRSKVVLV